MKRLVAVTLWVAVILPAHAQLLPPNDTGMTMGHVLLNVTNVDAHKKFWVDSFGAKPITVGKLQGITIPGLVVLFRPQPATGPGEAKSSIMLD
jgi:hypothetical protein